jgi:hypothetical protein
VICVRFDILVRVCSATTPQSLDLGASVGNAPAQLHATVELVNITPHGAVGLRGELFSVLS